MSWDINISNDVIDGMLKDIVLPQFKNRFISIKVGEISSGVLIIEIELMNNIIPIKMAEIHEAICFIANVFGQQRSDIHYRINRKK